MLLSLIRFLRGYVTFSVSGKFPERFINICLSRGIRLWGVSNRGEVFSASMYRADYLRARPLARGSKVRLRVISKKGLPSYILSYRDRIGLVFGVCAFILAVFIMSQFVWCIDITGLDGISQSEMTELLRENGLYVGAYKPLLDYKGVARSVMLEKREVGWMAVNITGSYASVQIEEEASAPLVEDTNSPCNIRAKCDGVILSVEAGEGMTAVSEGSGVVEGQVLVSGVVTNNLGDTRLVHADASVFAKTTHLATFSVPKTVATLKPDGDTAERTSFDLFGIKLPYKLGSVSSPYSITNTTVESPTPLDTTLPIGKVREEVYSLSKCETELDENSAKELLTEQSNLYEAFSLSDCTVLSREYAQTEGEGVFTLSVKYTCREDIAYSEPIDYQDLSE